MKKVKKKNDFSDIRIDKIFDKLTEKLQLKNSNEIKGGDVKCESRKSTILLFNNTSNS